MKLKVSKLYGADGEKGDARLFIYGKCGYLIKEIEITGKVVTYLKPYEKEIEINPDHIQNVKALYSGVFEYSLERTDD